MRAATLVCDRPPVAFPEALTICGGYVMKNAILLTLFCSLAPSTVVAQTDFFHAWENRVRATSAKQPAWPVPVIGSPSTIVQLARTDFVRQYTSTHTLTGNYATLVQLAFSVPTGSYKNGTAVSTITPTVVAGKGFRKFDVQSALGAVLPTSSVPTIGRTIQWNTTAQYQIGKYLWPEVEANASYFHGGANDGKSQVFVTPGLMVSKIKFRRDPKTRLGLVLGTGMQIATSSYHSYNHGLVLTGRIVF